MLEQTALRYSPATHLWPARVPFPISPPPAAPRQPLSPSSVPSCFFAFCWPRGERYAPNRYFPGSCPVTPAGNLPRLRPPWAGIQAQVPDHPALRGRETSVRQLGMADGEGNGHPSSSLHLQDSRLRAGSSAEGPAPPRASVAPAELCCPLHNGYRYKNRKRAGKRMDSAYGLRFGPRSDIFPTAFSL